ncbi:MAG TPA: hypothetical protein VKT77_05960 [Chthonomonadaceae bacterium]|nr:hypothetical protein [Chthonomonadaceae bacterium]
MLAALLPFASSAGAQTAYAPGGLFIHPTAFALPEHQLSLYAAAFTWRSPGETESTQFPVALTYTPTGRLQVSALALYHNEADEPPHTHIGAFLKYQIAPDSRSSPALAIAGTYTGRDHFETALSATSSHAFRSGGRRIVALHVGLKWLRTADKEGNQSDIGGFIGAQVPLGRNWDLVGETSTRLKIDFASATAFGVMYHSRRGTLLTFALLNDGLSQPLRPFFGVGLPLRR